MAHETAASASAKGRFTFLASSFSDAAPVHGQYASAATVSAASVQLEKVLTAQKKLNQHAREQNSAHLAAASGSGAPSDFSSLAFFLAPANHLWASLYTWTSPAAAMTACTRRGDHTITSVLSNPTSWAIL